MKISVLDVTPMLKEVYAKSNKKSSKPFSKITSAIKKCGCKKDPCICKRK